MGRKLGESLPFPMGVFHYGVRWVCSFVVLFRFVPGGCKHLFYFFSSETNQTRLNIRYSFVFITASFASFPDKEELQSDSQRSISEL